MQFNANVGTQTTSYFTKADDHLLHTKVTQDAAIQVNDSIYNITPTRQPHLPQHEQQRQQQIVETPKIDQTSILDSIVVEPVLPSSEASLLLRKNPYVQLKNRSAGELSFLASRRRDPKTSSTPLEPAPRKGLEAFAPLVDAVAEEEASTSRRGSARCYARRAKGEVEGYWRSSRERLATYKCCHR